MPVGFYKRGCQVKTLLLSREGGIFFGHPALLAAPTLFAERGSPGRLSPCLRSPRPASARRKNKNGGLNENPRQRSTRPGQTGIRLGVALYREDDGIGSDAGHAAIGASQHRDIHLATSLTFRIWSAVTLVRNLQSSAWPTNLNPLHH